jgi:hypothetical protein
VPPSSVTGHSAAAARLAGSTVAMRLTAAKIDGSRGDTCVLPAVLYEGIEMP